MRVRQLLEKKRETAITIELNQDVATAARLLMRHGIGALPVTGPDGKVVGLVSERDIVRAVDLSTDGVRERTLDKIMRSPPPACSIDATLQEVMTAMTRERLRHLVVIEDGEIAGVISVGDLVKHRLEQLETETGVLRDYVAARRAVT